MKFISAYLGLATAVGLGTASECVASTYNRQPMSFGAAAYGTARNADGWNFGPTHGGIFAGRAIYDAPVGGNLLLVLPFSTPRTMGAVPDAGQPGDLVLAFAALANYATSESFTGLLAPSAACGTTYDASSKIGIFTEPPAPGTAPGVLAIPQPGSSGYLWVMSAPLSVGPQQLEISRGALQAQSAEKGVE